MHVFLTEWVLIQRCKYSYLLHISFFVAGFCCCSGCIIICENFFLQHSVESRSKLWLCLWLDKWAILVDIYAFYMLRFVWMIWKAFNIKLSRRLAVMISIYMCQFLSIDVVHNTAVWLHSRWVELIEEGGRVILNVRLSGVIQSPAHSLREKASEYLRRLWGSHIGPLRSHTL